MTIQFKDESNQAEIQRLQNAVASLGDRLATIEPAPKPVKPDPKAEKAMKAEREKAVADLRHGLDARQVKLGQIDTAVAELCALVRQERDCRKALLETHGRLVEKELRRIISNDVAVSAIIQRQIGEALRPTSDRKQPKLAEAGKLQRDAILYALDALADDIDELLA